MATVRSPCCPSEFTDRRDGPAARAGAIALNEVVLRRFVQRIPSAVVGDAVQSACFFKNATVFSLNAATFSYSGACEQSSNMCSSELLMPFVNWSAKRVEACRGVRT